MSSIEYPRDLDREAMAKFVARCMGAGHLIDPYKPNESDDTFWTVDDGNDWKVKFFHENCKQMEIIHRYDNKEAENALASWVAHRTGGRIV